MDNYLYVGVKLYERVRPRRGVDFVTVLIVELLAKKFQFPQGTQNNPKNIFGRERNLGEVVEKSVGSLLAEVHLRQGEETGLLLDNVTANKTGNGVQE